MTDNATPRDDAEPDATAKTEGDEAAPPVPAPAPVSAPAPAPVSPPAPVATPVTPRPNYAFLAIVSMITVAADLGTKWWAIARLSAGFDGPEAQPIEWAKRIVVVKNHLVLVFARNPGGAWGILQGESEAVRRPFFLLISVAAVVFIVSLYRKLDPRQWALKWGLPLVLGGALGNLVDRIRYAYVVDFIRIWITRTFEWPTFNVADVAIVAGVGLMAIDMFTSRKPAPPAPEAPPPAPEG